MLATLVSLILAFGGTPQSAAPRGVAVSSVVQDQAGAALQGTEAELNRVNDNQQVGNLGSPFFGPAMSAQKSRCVQFSLRVRYWIM